MISVDANDVGPRGVGVRNIELFDLSFNLVEKCNKSKKNICARLIY